MTPLPAPLRAAMLADAAAEAPLEACGVVTIAQSGDWARYLPLPNAARAPDRYRIDPGHLYGAIRDADANGERIGAVFHSHPTGPAEPSDVDRAEWPDRSWLCVIAGRGAAGWDVRVHRIDGERR